MKPTFSSTLIIILFYNLSFAQNSSTYEIEKLKSPDKIIKYSSTKNILKNFDTKSEKCSLLPDSLIDLGENPFFAGIVTAYQEHRPFTISPDVIWLLISQGFSRHVTFNSEKLKHSIVNVDDVKEIIVKDTNIILGNPNNNWETIFPQFTKQIAVYTGEELINVLTANFSTTNVNTKIASQITIMESMKGYFEYTFIGRGCGIPKITIEGTIEDWQKILEKTKYLSKYDLYWWTSELEPIIKEIINAKKGNFKKEFWMNMVKVHSPKEYGAKTQITGWIIKFFPYDKHGKRTNFKPIENVLDMPSEIVRVPFVFVDESTKARFDMEFWAGFFGLTQNIEDYTLTPEIGWMINYKEENKTDNKKE